MSNGERKPEAKKKAPAAAEKASKFLRDINALGASAIGGVAIIAPPAAAVGLGIWAGVNAAQAAGFEVTRRHFKKRALKNTQKNGIN